MDRFGIVGYCLKLMLIPLILITLSCGEDKSSNPDEGEVETTPAGGILVTSVNSPGTGVIAVRLELPEEARYPDGAPIVVHASTFFAPFEGFHRVFETTRAGAICISYLRPGRDDPFTGTESDGVPDHGGPASLAAFRDVIRFALGLDPNTDGYIIGELLDITPLTDNVGIFASSHSGIVATNVMAHHGASMPGLKYFVGRENPTRDEMYPLELGHFDDRRHQVYNPYYIAEDYTPTMIHIDYTKIGWFYDGDNPNGRPDFVAQGGGAAHLLHVEICPTMFNKRFYSRGLTQALYENGVLSLDNWPEDLAKPQETQDIWPFRTTVHNYPLIGAAIPDLKVMLVFAEKDHVQAAPDKPHIRQAYDGFKNAGITWIRLNPDRVYAQDFNEIYGSEMPDNVVNTEPADWMAAETWGFPSVIPDTKYEIPVAAVAEMADRVRVDNWSLDLDEVLYEAVK